MSESTDVQTQRVLTLEEALAAGWTQEAAPGFVRWMQRADRLVEAATGLSLNDFPDWNWAGSYEDGDSPASAAAMFVSDMIEEGLVSE